LYVLDCLCNEVTSDFWNFAQTHETRTDAHEKRIRRTQNAKKHFDCWDRLVYTEATSPDFIVLRDICEGS
jgi:hypothetical protein